VRTMPKKHTKSEQQTLYGGSVSGDYTAPEQVRVKVWEEVREIGDSLIMQIDGASLNQEAGCLTIFDNSDEAKTRSLTVFFAHHPDSQYKDGQTDGARFGNAVARCVGPIDSNEALEGAIADGGFTLTVAGTDYNGGFARLWTVTRSA
jgi:hypothetical protein